MYNLPNNENRQNIKNNFITNVNTLIVYDYIYELSYNNISLFCNNFVYNLFSISILCYSRYDLYWNQHN